MANPQVLGQAVDAVTFIGITASADFAGLVGTSPWVTLNAKDIRFGLNMAIANGYPLPLTYIDFSSINDGGARGMDIPIGTGATINMAELDAFEIRIGMQANMGLFDLFEINAPAFDFSFELQGVDLIPRIDLSSLLNFKVDIPASAPKLSNSPGALIQGGGAETPRGGLMRCFCEDTLGWGGECA